MRYPRKWPLAVVCLLALAALPLVPARRGAAQSAGYVVTDLGSLGGTSAALALDECGNVVGESKPSADGSNHPFYWSGGQMTDLGTFGGAGGTATGINRNGQVSGAARRQSGEQRAFIWTAATGKTDLGSLGGGAAAGYDINDAAQVVGQAEVAPLQERAFIWQQAPGMQTLSATGGSPYVAYGINNAGKTVGAAATSSGTVHAFLIDGGVLQDLGTLGGATSIAYRISDADHVAGYSYLQTNTADPVFHAFVYKNTLGMLDLGTLGGTRSIAYDVNVHGQAVGVSDTVPRGAAMRAFVWTQTAGIQDLNVLVPNTGWTFVEARGINDRGQIVGTGVNPDGQTRAFLLTPTNVAPSPCAATPTPTPGPSPSPTPTPNSPPSVALTSPAAGATFMAPAAVTLGANASDTDGSVSRVDFYAGAQLVGTDASTPYSFTWSNVPAGTYSLTAVAVDDKGAATTSAAVSIQVNPEAVPAGLQYYPLARPVRLLDTRPGAVACHTPAAPLVANASRTQAATGACDGLAIPAAARAIVGNATVVSPSSAGFITLYPSDAPLPTVSNLNYVKDQIVPNAFTVGVSASGSFNIYTPTSTHFIIDVAGYYAPPGEGGLYYHPLPRPVRLLDTRPGASACHAPGSPLQAGGARTESARTTCNGVVLPSDALAIVGNATVVNTAANSATGHITLYPGGAARPVASNLNYVRNQIVPNAFTVGLGADGSFNIYAATQTHFIVDVTGYYSASAAGDANGVSGLLLRPLASPVRLLDTRAGTTACSTPGAPLAADGVRTQGARGACGGAVIASTAQAILGNATVVNTASANNGGYIILYPSGAERPVVSNLNYVAGQIVPNAFNVGLGADGSFNIYTPTSTHFIVDVAGYFAP